ncbi:MAG TPA: IS1380 family transposase [Pirellulales bacterium]|nr:IS1380 family transposase [Pirellulales bacterium]
MTTECNAREFDFQGLGSRAVTARFDGGAITSDAGGLLLREVEAKTGILRRFAACFTDHRDPERIEHTVPELMAQRIFALALGYEDLNDHDALRHDPLLAVLVGKADPTGRDRRRREDRGKSLAGKSMLNRLELTPVGADEKSRYKKVVARHRDIENFFIEMFLLLHPAPPKEIVLDFDATDDPIHGHQLGRFFHGYYDGYCYLPLYIFCGEHLLCAKLRPADIDGAAGSVKQLAKIVERIRLVWPKMRIIVRGDSGFCRENLMRWCEENHVDYVLGLAKNARLERILGKELHEAKLQFAATGQASRVFKDFTYQTRKSWSRERRVVGKAEHLSKGGNPRFIVTSLLVEELDARTLYEDMYCARGEMENRIKEQQMCLFADRTSCATMRANQLRLWLSSAAYTLLMALRQFGLQGTEMATARCDTIRLKLLKLGALVRTTVRRVWISMSESWPYRRVFAQVYENLRRWSLPLPASG